MSEAIKLDKDYRPFSLGRVVEDEVQKMCDEAFERGLKAGQEKQYDEAFNEAVDPEKFEVRCEIEFDVQCDKPVPEAIAAKACYHAALAAAIGFGRDQGLDYCDIECDLSDAYDRQVEAEAE